MKTSALSRLLRALPLLAALLLPVSLPAGQPPPPALLSLDSDGDGQPDVAEWFNHTDATNGQDAIRITGIEALTSPNRLRLTWQSVAGQTYAVDRNPGDGPWTRLGQVTATGATASYTLPFPAGEESLLFRIAAPYDATRPPYVRRDGSTAPVTAAGFVQITVAAYHPNGIESVALQSNGVPLTMGSPGANGMWTFLWPVDASQNGSQAITLTARTASGLVQSSTVAQLVNIPAGPPLTGLPGQFVRLDAAGEPMESATLRPDAGGNLPPCEWRPAGSAPEGGAQWLALRFRQGARVITGASPRLEFTRVQLAGGPRGLLVPDGVVERATAAVQSLPLGELTVAQLSAVFGLNAAEGIPVRIFGLLPARLHAGTLRQDGLAGPLLRPSGELFAALPQLGGSVDFAIDFTDPDALRLPFHGEFNLPDASGFPAALKIGPQAPAWVTIRRDGSLSFGGRGELSFGQNGPRFMVELAAGAPEISFELAASGLQASFGAALKPTLPPAQTLTAATPANAATLTPLALQLGAKLRAYERFAAAFADAAPPEANAPPRETRGGTSGLLDALASSVLGGAAPTMPAGMAAIIKRAGRAASGGTTIPASLEQWLTLERVRFAGFSTAELTAARTEATAALRRRFDSTSEPFTMEDAYATMTAAVERSRLIQQLNATDDSAAFLTDVTRALNSALSRHAASLLVAAGQFSPPPGSPVLTMDRFTATRNLEILAGSLEQAHLLGIDGNLSAPVDELTGQLGRRVEGLLRAALDAAESSGDAAAFLYALEDYTQLHAWHQSGIIGGAATLVLLDLESLLARYAALLDPWLAARQQQWPVEKEAEQAERLTKILRSVPPGITVPQDAITRAHDRLLQALNGGITLLNQTTLPQAMALLRGGLEHARLRDQLGLPAGSPEWESASRLSAVVDRIAAKGAEFEDAVAVHDSALLLLSEAERLATGNQTRRRLCLLEAQKLAAVVRSMAVSWCSRAPNGGATLLAGGIAVDEAAGGLKYNTLSKQFAGWCSGKLRLPGANTAFTLSRLSLSTGGAFDLECHGSVTLPPGAASPARFSVPARRPLHFSFRRPDRLTLSGGGMLEVNGMTFEAWTVLDDPLYVFGAAASGLSFDLGDKLRIMVPVPPSPVALTPVFARDVTDAVNAIGAAFEPLVNLDLPAPPSPGEPPEFSAALPGSPFAMAEAWANRQLAAARLGLNADISGSLAEAGRMVAAASGQIEHLVARDCINGASLQEAMAAIRLLLAYEKAGVAWPAVSTGLGQEILYLRSQLVAYFNCLFQHPELLTESNEVTVLEAIEAFLVRGATVRANLPPGLETLHVPAATFIFSSMQVRLPAIGLDTNTAAVTNEATLLGMTVDRNETILTGMMLRRNLLTLVEGTPYQLPHAPEAAAVVLDNALHHLMRARRHLLVLDARSNLAALPSGEGVANANGYVPAGHPLLEQARAHARTARRILDRRQELDVLMQRVGYTPRPGERYIRVVAPDFIWPQTGSPNAASLIDGFYETDSTERTITADKILGAEDPGSPGYDPLISQSVYDPPGAAPPVSYQTRPRWEGLFHLDAPYGSVPEGMKRLLPAPQPQDPAALRNAWAAYMGSLPGLQRVPLNFYESLISRLQVEVARYVALPAAEASAEAGLAIASQLSSLLDMAANSGSPLLPQLQVSIAQFDTAFRAVVTAKKAWWYASAYARLWTDAAERGAARGIAALQQTAGGLASAAAQAGLTLVRDIALLLPSSRPADLALPGNLRVESVRGEVSYRRDTQMLSASFGGRLELPGKQAFFEVVDLSLNSAGSFSATLSGGGPLPFAPDIRIENVTGAVTGSTAGLSAFSATGRLSFPGSGGNVLLNGGFSYAGPSGGQPAKVAFNAAIDGTNLPRFTDNLVLFSGSVGVEFPLTQTPPPVKLSVAGKAGLFQREQPLAAPIAAEDFWLSVDLNGLDLRMETAPSRRATLTFNGGTLRFPSDLFFTKTTPPAQPQPFTIALGGGLTACYDFDAQDLCFGSPNGDPWLLNLPTLGFFNIPGLPESKVEITTAQLRLHQAEFPVLASLAADFKFPLPGATGQAAAAAFKLNATEWRIDGLPQQASIQLTQDLPLLPWLQEASLSVLNGASIQLTDAALPSRPGYRRLTLTASGGMRAGLNPQTVSTETGGSVALSTTGTFTWPFDYRPFVFGAPPEAPQPQPPSLIVQDVIFEGRFRLGGANGFLIRGVENTLTSKAKLVFSGGSGGSLENVLHRTAAKPFFIGFAGTLDIPAVGAFTVGDITDPSRLTRFVWDDNGSVIPRFLPIGFNVALSGQVLRAADLVMPLYLSSAGFAFINENLTLPALLDPSNIKIIASGVAQFPNGAAISLGSPGLRGEFTNVAMTFPKVNGNYTAKLENISALTMELKNLSIPYVSDVSGSVSVRNLAALQANPPRPLDLYFAGEVTGKMRGAGVSLLFAASPREFLGACAGLGAGVSGIPLDGYALGGILLTGVEGGLSLQNSFADPCDFRSYVNAPAGAQQMPPAGSPQRPGNPGPLLFPDPPGAPSSQFFDCTGPGFPPPTMNPFCQPHPTIQGRAIFKGARLTATQLNALGIVSTDPRLSVTLAQGLDACMAGIDFAVQRAVSGMTAGLTGMLQQLRTGAAGNPTMLKLVEQAANDGLGLAGRAGAALDSAIADQCRAIFRAALLEAFEQGTAINPNQTLYQFIVTRADEGLKCVDVTVRGSGTFTWQPLSILFDATGSVFLSTTGTQGVEGSLNFLGTPMAKGTAAYMITDTAGNVNPGFGGVADLAIGPFGFGKVSLAAQSGSSVNTVVIAALTSLFATADTLAPAVRTWIGGILREVAGLPAPPVSLQAGFAGLTEEQRLRLMSRFLAESKRLAVTVSDSVVRDQLFDVIAGLIATVLQSQESTMCMGGQMSPTLFGMPLTGGADTLVGGGVRYQPVTEGGTRYYEMSGQVTFSPTTLSLYPVLWSYATALPQLDEATLGMSIRIPSPDKNGVKLALTNPVQWAKNMTNAVINDTVATANYSVAPLGFRLEEVRARVILPRIEKHPNNPASGWTGPPSGAAFATREEVVLAALDRGYLGNAQWRGNAGDLDDLFRNVPAGTGCSALTQQAAARMLAADPTLAGMSGKGFAADYFPHGGMIFGGQWQMPNVIAQAPPLATIATVLAGPQTNTPQAVLAWINTTKALVDGYLLATTCTGQLAGYVPSPSPVPAGVDWSALQADPAQWLSALSNPGGLLGTAFPGSLSDTTGYAAWAAGRRTTSLGLLNRVVNRETLNGLYPFNQTFFRGWCQAPLLGLPLAQASASWDGNAKKLMISAQGAPGGWLAQHIGGNFTLEVSPPQYVAGVTTPTPAGTAADSPDERLTALRGQLDSVTSANYTALAPSLTSALLNVLPRVKLDTAVNFTPPAAWQSLLGTTALSGRLYAYSAGFDTTATGSDPESQAKRSGGMLLRANMSFGPFLQSANAYASLTPNGTSLPRLNADLSVNGLTLPGPTPVSVALASGRATFDSQTGVSSITGTLTQSLTLPTSMLPWSVTMPATTTSVTATGNTVEFTFSLNQVPASIVVTSNGITSSAVFSGTLLFNTLTTSALQLAPSDGLSSLRVVVSNNIGTLANGRSIIGGLFAKSANLPPTPVTWDATNGLQFAPMPIAAPLAGTLSGFNVSSLTWSLRRSGATLSVVDPAVTIPSLPGFDPAAIAFPANAANVVNTDGSFSFGFSAALPEIRSGRIALNAPGTTATASLTSVSGLRLHGGTVGMLDPFRIPAPPAPFAPAPYPNLTIPASGTADAVLHTFTCRPILSGYAFGDTTMRLERVGGALQLAVTAGSLPVPGGGPALTSFNGTVRADGAVNLSQASSAALYGFPVSGSLTYSMNRPAGTHRSLLVGDGAQAAWKLDETALGATVLDATGNGHQGTLVSQPLVNQQPARPGSSGAYTFDGSDDAVTIPDHDSLEGGSAMSIAAWIRVSSFTQAWQPVVTKGDSAWRLHRSGSTGFIAFGTSNPAAHDLTSTIAVNDGQWHHVVGVFNGTQKLLYIDGVLNASTAWTGPIAANTQPVMIGGNSEQAARRWIGSIDEVGFYRRALTAAEIAAQWGGGRPEGWWKLDDQLLTSPLTVLDSASGRHGSASGSGIPAIGAVTALTSESGRSFRFDGIDDAVTIPHHANLEGGSAMTIAAWVRVNAFDRTWQTIAAKGDNSWRLARNENGSTLRFDTNHVGGAHFLAGTTPVDDGRWHHVCATWNGTSKRLYIDGVLDASGSMTTAINASTWPVTIGENAQSTGRFWNGWIDEVVFHRRALTDAQVLDLARSGAGIFLDVAGTLSLHSTFTGTMAGSLAANGDCDASFTAAATQVIAGPSFDELALRFIHAGTDTRVTGTARLRPLPVLAPYPATLGGTPRFSVSLTRSGSSTLATLAAGNVTVTLGGYTPKAPGFSLSLTGNLGTQSLLGFSGFRFGPFGSSELTDIGFAPMSGSIDPADGFFSAGLLTGQSLNLRNQLATGVQVSFGNAGLQLFPAPFTLSTTIGGTKRDWGSVNFSGFIQPNGSYDLTGSAALTFGGFATDSFAMRFRSPDFGTWSIAPAAGVTPNLNFGALDVPLPGLGFHANGWSGITDVPSPTIEKGWTTRGVMGIQDYFWGRALLSYDFAANSLTARLDGSVTDWKWRTTLPGAPEHRIRLAGPIGSDGRFRVEASRFVSGSGLNWIWPVPWSTWNFTVFPFEGGSGSFDGPLGIAAPRAPLW